MSHIVKPSGVSWDFQMADAGGIEDILGPNGTQTRMARYTTDASGNITGLVGATTDYPISSADIVIFGATPAGVAAAVSAARLNKKVVLLSESDRLGGMVGWGINQQDVNVAAPPGVVTGFPRELFTRISSQETADAKAFRRYHRLSCPTRPSWVRRAMAEIVGAERNISVVYNCTLSSVAKSGTTISSITVSPNGGSMRFSGSVFIDASVCGDLAAAAGCTISIGREANATYSETLNGIRTVSNWAGSATVDPYVTAGVSGSGLLPFVDSSGQGTVGAADGKVMLFNFRLFVTTNVSDQVAFPAPDMSTYNVQNYELLARAMASVSTSYDSMAEVFNMYSLSVMSAGYYDMNSKGGISTNYPNQSECLEYVTATPARRAVIAENAKQYLLGLLYWIRYSGDSRIPAALVTEIATYGLVASELKAYDNFSPEFYVREARRVVGDFVMDENDLSITNGFTDQIGFASYDVDSHMVRLTNVAGAVKPEGAILTTMSESAAPQIGSLIPYRVLLPKAAECTNLLTPTAPSVSRVVWCTLRMEPVMMMLGHAAGVAATQAINEDVTVANIDTARLQRIQDPYQVWDGIVLATNTYTHGTLTTTGSWSTLTSRWGYLGTSGLSDGNAGKGSRSLKFAPNIDEAGAYEVFFKYPSSTTARANNVPVSIVHADGTTTITVNQLYPGGMGGHWESLGVYTFAQGLPSAHYVLVDNTGTSDFVVASAVKWKRVAGWQ